MVLELNLARLRRFLEGATPEDRFHDFVRRLRQPDFQERTTRREIMVKSLVKDYQTLRKNLEFDYDENELRFILPS